MDHFAPPGPLGFGGAPLGNMYEAVDDATAEAALTAAWTSGVRYFDIRAAALQFCAAHPVVAAVIPGAKRADKVTDNARLMATPIPAAFWRELKEEYLIPAHAPTPDEGQAA